MSEGGGGGVPSGPGTLPKPALFCLCMLYVGLLYVVVLFITVCLFVATVLLPPEASSSPMKPSVGGGAAGWLLLP